MCVCCSLVHIKLAPGGHFAEEIEVLSITSFWIVVVLRERERKRCHRLNPNVNTEFSPTSNSMMYFGQVTKRTQT